MGIPNRLLISSELRHLTFMSGTTFEEAAQLAVLRAKELGEHIGLVFNDRLLLVVPDDKPAIVANRLLRLLNGAAHLAKGGVLKLRFPE